MTVLEIVLAVLTAISCGTALTLFVRGRQRPTAGPPPELETVPSNVVDAAYAEIDRAQDGGGVIFGLPPKYVPKTPEEPVPLASDGQVEVEGHPCDYLSGVVPPRFRAGECEGICWHRDRSQRGRVCFWAPPSASNCPWFQPRVRLTRVKLKKIEGGKKSA